MATPDTRLLDAAEALFYARGFGAVGMDDLRQASGLSLKQIYALYPGKYQLLEAVLSRRDTVWHSQLSHYVETSSAPTLLAVFDWLYQWFQEPHFRGCAWVNAFGELGSTSPALRRQARDHKARFRAYLGGLVAEAGLSAETADHLTLLAEGAMTTAAISGNAEPALSARAAAQRLVQVAPAAAVHS